MKKKIDFEVSVQAAVQFLQNTRILSTSLIEIFWVWNTSLINLQQMLRFTMFIFQGWNSKNTYLAQ